MSIPKIKIQDLIERLRQYPDLIIQEAANQLEDFNNDWHQPELCNEKYNNLVEECNHWEELCEDMYDYIFSSEKSGEIELEKRYLTLKGHYEH